MTTTTAEQLGFTASEYEEQCNRIRRFTAYVVPSQSIAPFLDRCCEGGLLTKHKDDQGSVRYVPTQLLRAWLPDD